MRLTQTLFLTGTILPALVLAGMVQARPQADAPGGASAPRIELAQAPEREERRGGGGGGERAGGGERGGAGGGQRGGPDREGPPAARERPEAPAARERPEPRPAARPEPREERAAPPAREKPEPREERAAPPAREKPEPRPAARPERDERPAPPAAREKEAPAARERETPPAREKPATRPEREERAPPSARERDEPRDERPARPERNAPERPAAPERPTPPSVRQPEAPVAPNQRPGVPGKPVAPSGQPDRIDDKRDRREDQQQRREEIREDRQERHEDRQDRLDDRREHRQDIQKQRLENQDQRLENNQQRLENQRDRERMEDARERRDDAQDRRDRFNAPGRPGYTQGGFRGDAVVIRDFGVVRRERQQYDVGGRLYYREPGRVIVRDRDTYYVRHDENERFRRLYQGGGYRTERRGQDNYSYIERPGGEQIVTVTDDDGRLVRRVRRFRDGREVVLINNGYGGGRPAYEDVIDLPPPRIAMPRERYQLDYGRSDPRSVAETLSAPPVEPLQRRYSLDQVRYSPQVRARMPSVDIDTITFESGSFEVSPDQGRQLDSIAAAINQAVKANPQEVFLIEGYTDAVGDDVDNLSLSDRRAQSVAQILTESFKVPPENLTTQGYGEQYLKIDTPEAARENRRVTVRRITPLLDQQASAGRGDAPPR